MVKGIIKNLILSILQYKFYFFLSMDHFSLNRWASLLKGECAEIYSTYEDNGLEISWSGLPEGVEDFKKKGDQWHLCCLRKFNLAGKNVRRVQFHFKHPVYGELFHCKEKFI